MSKKKAASKTPKDKDALPLKLPVATVRRAVELAMMEGYFLALLDYVSHRGGGRKFLSDEVKKLFSKDEPFNPDIETYEPVIRNHIEFSMDNNRFDVIGSLIGMARVGGLSSEALASANAVAGKRGRKEVYPIPEQVLQTARARFDAEQVRRGGVVGDRTRVSDKWWRALHEEFKEQLGQRSWSSFRDRVYKVKSGEN